MPAKRYATKPVRAANRLSKNWTAVVTTIGAALFFGGLQTLRLSGYTADTQICSNCLLDLSDVLKMPVFPGFRGGR